MSRSSVRGRQSLKQSFELPLFENYYQTLQLTAVTIVMYSVSSKMMLFRLQKKIVVEVNKTWPRKLLRKWKWIQFFYFMFIFVLLLSFCSPSSWAVIDHGIGRPLLYGGTHFEWHHTSPMHSDWWCWKPFCSERVCNCVS